MSFLAYLMFIAILLGTGTLLASAIPGRGARIGLGTALFLALVVDLTWFVAPLSGWSARLADAAWVGAFGLAASAAWLTSRHYNRQKNLPVWEWPTEQDWLLLLLVVAIFGVVVLVLPVPLDTDAQGFGYLALTLREGGDFTTLAPWHSEIDYLYAPAHTGLIAHLSARLDLGIHTLQLLLGAAVCAVFVWLAYDLGCELGNRRTGRAYLVAAMAGTGLVTAFMDSHFTALMALLFSLAFLTFVLRFLDTWRWSNVLGAALCLAAVPLSQPDTTLALIMGYAPWLVVVWLSKPRPGAFAWLVLVLVIPLVALGIVSPWLMQIMDLLESGIDSPFEVNIDHWHTLVLTHGGVIAVLAGLGALIGLRQRSPAQWLAIVWLVSIVEFSTLGLLEEAFPDVVGPLLKYDYPFSLAWHGPIIPYVILGGTFLVWMADRLGGGFDRLLSWLAWPTLAVGFAGLIVGFVLFDQLLSASKDTVDFFGAFSSEADVEAMRWLRDNAPEDARVLNHPGPHEGDWAPIISERDTVFFRSQPFFSGTDLAEQEQDYFRQVWDTPSEDQLEIFTQYDVSYVLIPQVFGNPASLDDMVRWRSPLKEAAGYYDPAINDLSFLELVFEQDGARVYRVVTGP